MVGDHDLDVGVLLDDADEGGGAGIGFRIGGGIDLLVDDLGASLLEGIDHSDGAPAAVSALALQPPDENLVAFLEAGALCRFRPESKSGRIVRRPDIAEALCRIFRLCLRQRRRRSACQE